MLAFTHAYIALPIPLSTLDTLDELRRAVETPWQEMLATEDYREGDTDRQYVLRRLTIDRMTTWQFGYRLQKDTRWLRAAVESGESFQLEFSGYPSRYFCRGSLVLPQLDPAEMKDVSDLLRPAALPSPRDWVYIEEWDQS